MLPQPDYSVLDQPQLLQFVFYPRRDWTPRPDGANDYLIPVEEGVSISCRYYPAGKGSPCILFFHGNGEVASDYDWIASIYNDQGIGLFVADYRGYGRSSGTPTFSTMMRDAHSIFNFFANIVGSQDQGRLFVMGRSLGSQSAMEIAYQYAQSLSGLIIESGSANMAKLLSFLGITVDRERVKDFEEAVAAKLGAITLPVLILHGEVDSLIPAREATRLFNSIGSEVKRLVIIPGVGHNDIMLGGMEEYFSAIMEFVFSQ